MLQHGIPRYRVLAEAVLFRCVGAHGPGHAGLQEQSSRAVILIRNSGEPHGDTAMNFPPPGMPPPPELVDAQLEVVRAGRMLNLILLFRSICRRDRVHHLRFDEASRRIQTGSRARRKGIPWWRRRLARRSNPGCGSAATSTSTAPAVKLRSRFRSADRRERNHLRRGNEERGQMGIFADAGRGRRGRYPH